jgi:hypothetical protein
MIVSSTTIIVLSVKRNYTIMISKNGSPLPPKDNKPVIPYKKRIAVYDDGTFSGSMKGKTPASTRRINDAF